MSISRILKLVTGIFEAILGFPLVGASIIIYFLWTPLFVMFILHIITLLMTRRDGGAIAGSVLGIITSLIAWIPGVGIVMHIVTAIFLLVNAATPDRASRNQNII